jgi:RHS repeat-associated protein
MESPETFLCRYAYDALDRLTGLVPSEQEQVQRFYNIAHLATELQGQTSRTVFQQGAQLLALQQREGDEVNSQLLATDQQRSVLHAIDGVQHRQKVYSPYGHRRAESGLSSLLGFNGERPDPVTGHYLLGNGHRAFNPVLMRFNSPDRLSPFGRGGLNPYAYCLGDPVNFSDPTGRITWQSGVFLGWNVLDVVSAASGFISIRRSYRDLKAMRVGEHQAYSRAKRDFILGAVGTFFSTAGLLVGAARTIVRMADPDNSANDFLLGASFAMSLPGYAFGLISKGLKYRDYKSDKGRALLTNDVTVARLSTSRTRTEQRPQSFELQPPARPRPPPPTPGTPQVSAPPQTPRPNAIGFENFSTGRGIKRTFDEMFGSDDSLPMVASRNILKAKRIRNAL